MTYSKKSAHRAPVAAKKRQGIDNITRLKICQFVASQRVPPSTKIVREWAEATFGRHFPQSTLSTLLRSNGLQIKQAGGRGRRCRTDRTPSVLATADANKQARSARTNVLISHLKLLADGRCRGRSSDHPEIELAILEEAYLRLQRETVTRASACTLSVAWFHALTRSLFAQHREPLPKNISQFLNQIYDKYFLINLVYKHLTDDLTYVEMRTKLGLMYPGLAMLPAKDMDNLSTPVHPQQQAQPQPHQQQQQQQHLLPQAVKEGEPVFWLPSPALAPHTPPPDVDEACAVVAAGFLPVPTGMYTPPMSSTQSPPPPTFLPAQPTTYEYMPAALSPPTELHFPVVEQQHDQWSSPITVMEHYSGPAAAPLTPDMEPIPMPANSACILIPPVSSYPVYAPYGDYQEDLDLGYNLLLDNVFN